MAPFSVFGYVNGYIKNEAKDDAGLYVVIGNSAYIVGIISRLGRSDYLFSPFPHLFT